MEPSGNIENCGRADRNISRLFELGQNIDILVAPVEIYLAWWNLVETQKFVVVPIETYPAWSNLVKT